jgi:hypothetical protein
MVSENSGCGEGLTSLKPYLTDCPPELRELLYAQRMVSKGLQCTCGSRVFKLRFYTEKEEGALFALCNICGGFIKVFDSAQWGWHRTKEPDFYHCSSCGNDLFIIGLAFEYPNDAKHDDDLSWIVFAAQCGRCLVRHKLDEWEIG